MRDELEYELPGGRLYQFRVLVLRPFLLGRLFAYRHAVTRRSVTAGARDSRASRMTVRPAFAGLLSLVRVSPG